MNKENQQNLANRSFSEDESPQKLCKDAVHASPSPPKLNSTPKQTLQSLIKGIESAFLKQRSRSVKNVSRSGSSPNKKHSSSDKNDIINTDNDSNLKNASGGVKENCEEDNTVRDQKNTSLENIAVSNENQKKEHASHLEQNRNSTILNKCTDTNEEKSKHHDNDVKISEGLQEEDLSTFSLGELLQRVKNDRNDNYIKNEEKFVGHKYKIKKLSLPKMHSGCTLLIDGDSEMVKISNYAPEVIKYPHQDYLNISNSRSISGSVVIFGNLAKHVTIPSESVDVPIVINNVVSNRQTSEAFQKETLVWRKCKSSSKLWSGGFYTEDFSYKIRLPELFPLKNFLHEQTNNSSFQGSPSGGSLIRNEAPYSVTLTDLL